MNDQLSRREALLTLSAITVSIGVGASLAADGVDFPLWVIEEDGGRVYLLGHTFPMPENWKNERIQNLLPSCRAYWNETNNISRLNIQELIQRHGVDPEGLAARLSAEDRDRLSQAAKIAGVPEESIAQFRPWLAGQILENTFIAAPGLSGRNADHVLVEQAMELGIPISSEFATQDEALIWFSELSPVQEVQYLRYIVDEILSGHEEVQRWCAEWASGNGGPMAAWIARMERLYPELYQAIAVERNQRWVPRFKSMLQEDKPTMVVLGFGHLVGPDSVQEQLRQNGLIAQRL